MIGDYTGTAIEVQFLDADKPAYPMALPTGEEFDVVRTTVSDQGRGKDHLGRDVRHARVTHYVRRQQ